MFSPTDKIVFYTRYLVGFGCEQMMLHTISFRALYILLLLYYNSIPSYHTSSCGTYGTRQVQNIQCVTAVPDRMIRSEQYPGMYVHSVFGAYLSGYCEIEQCHNLSRDRHGGGIENAEKLNRYNSIVKEVTGWPRKIKPTRVRGPSHKTLCMFFRT